MKNDNPKTDNEKAKYAIKLSPYQFNHAILKQLREEFHSQNNLNSSIDLFTEAKLD